MVVEFQIYDNQRSRGARRMSAVEGEQQAPSFFIREAKTIEDYDQILNIISLRYDEEIAAKNPDFPPDEKGMTMREYENLTVDLLKFPDLGKTYVGEVEVDNGQGKKLREVVSSITYTQEPEHIVKYWLEDKVKRSNLDAYLALKLFADNKAVQFRAWFGHPDFKEHGYGRAVFLHALGQAKIQHKRAVIDRTSWPKGRKFHTIFKDQLALRRMGGMKVESGRIADVNFIDLGKIDLNTVDFSKMF